MGFDPFFSWVVMHCCFNASRDNSLFDRLCLRKWFGVLVLNLPVQIITSIAGHRVLRHLSSQVWKKQRLMRKKTNIRRFCFKQFLVLYKRNKFFPRRQEVFEGFTRKYVTDFRLKMKAV